MTTYIWDNETPEIKQDIADCIEQERGLITAFKEGTLKASDLSDDKKAAIIDSLYHNFEGMFKNLVDYLKWGVMVIAGGIDPRTGRIRTVGYNYGCTMSDGKDFIRSFNNAAEAGHIPGTTEGESRAFSQYYGLPFMHHMKKVQLSHNGLAQKEENIESSVGVDPATLVHDDATGSAVAVLGASDNSNSFQLPVEVTAPVAQPHVALPAEKSSIPSPVIHSSLASDNSHSFQLPVEVTALVAQPHMALPAEQSFIPSPVIHSSLVVTPSASVLSSPATTAVAPHTPETVFVSPKSNASNAFQGLELLQSGTPMDTSSDFLNVLPWTYSHSDDSMRPLHSVMSSPGFPGIDNNHSGAHPAGSQQTVNSSFNMDVDLLEWAKTVESHSSLDGKIFHPNDNLSQIMQSLGLSDMFGSDAASDQSTHTATEPFYAAAAASGTSNSQNAPTSSNQLTIDIIMHDSDAVADCRRTPTPTPVIRSALFSGALNLLRQPRQRKAPPPREVITLCEQDLGPPQWHQECLTALQDQSLGPAWISLVEKWYKLKSDMWKVKANTEGKYPHGKRRPQELKVWLDGVWHFNAGMFIPDMSRYGEELIDWWNHVNPAWRRSNDISGLPRPDYSKPLKCLHKGGRQDVVTVVFGLFWWGRACHATEELWFRMVEDVSKTFDILMQ
ncbi:uncharacterized protein ARMOST_10423 [Armillaria ostoyae]|uniref:Uncharacterized protein n=1 Tax=Armillaria ostoyae TaxID=47428 RepID=A0A284RE89_ARMOS|nr:uncharacterized protein ARMOST_10423 [Armillaria ostoyae]